MQINFLRYKKIYFVFSGVLIMISIGCLAVFGLNPGIDFTGGSILEVRYKEARPSNAEIEEILKEIGLEGNYVQPTEEKGVIIRMQDITEGTHQEVIQKLSAEKELEEMRFEAIGSVIGEELKSKTKVIIVLSLLSIVLYVAFAFRRVQRPLRSWQFGIASLVALFHDVLVPLGIFSILGEFYGVQVTIPVVVALLTVLGYSINNTVVVFDRIRENLIKRTGVTFEDTVEKSLNQTLTRCINTSLTTLMVLSAIFFFGGVTLKYFSLALILGIVAGTYSSIFLVSPLLVSWLAFRQRRVASLS